MTRVIIVRHGQSTYNTEKRIQGRTDFSTLTEKGRNDAAKVGQAIYSISFNAAYCSPLQRAKQTAEIICSQLGINAIPVPSGRLLEVDLPLWERMLSAEVKQKFGQDYRIWQEKPDEFYMLVPDGEGTRKHFPVLSLYAQAQQFWQEILPRHQGETILIVGHNGINRALISTALGIAPSRYQSVQQSNCGVSVLNFSGSWGEPVQLESLNQTQHMGDILPSLRPNHQGIRLLLVRHGETEWNREGRYQGQIDVNLNQEGKLQSQKTAQLLQNVELDLMVSSSMVRAKETAEIILQHHQGVRLDLHDGFKEIIHGLWEGKLETEIEQEFPGQLQQWRTIPTQLQVPLGENLAQLWQRTVQAFDYIIKSALNEQLKTISVVAHGGINQVLLCHILGLSAESFWSFRQSNGAVSVIDYPKGFSGLPVLQAMNINSHISKSVLDMTATGAL
ncbi:MAG: histidine phosphatase family protein [Nostocaceae cyanobacterium]|nr:histidine phosphatase family protein [Nostocaceae cyanobacterium]